jgi:hypothetical protein
MYSSWSPAMIAQSAYSGWLMPRAGSCGVQVTIGIAPRDATSSIIPVPLSVRGLKSLLPIRSLFWYHITTAGCAPTLFAKVSISVGSTVDVVESFTVSRRYGDRQFAHPGIGNSGGLAASPASLGPRKAWSRRRI